MGSVPAVYRRNVCRTDIHGLRLSHAYQKQKHNSTDSRTLMCVMPLYRATKASNARPPMEWILPLKRDRQWRHASARACVGHRLRCTIHCRLFGDAFPAAYYFIVRPHSFTFPDSIVSQCLRIAWLQSKRNPNYIRSHTHTHTARHNEGNERKRWNKKKEEKKKTKEVIVGFCMWIKSTAYSIYTRSTYTLQMVVDVPS